MGSQLPATWYRSTWNITCIKLKWWIGSIKYKYVVIQIYGLYRRYLIFSYFSCICLIRSFIFYSHVCFGFGHIIVVRSVSELSTWLDTKTSCDVCTVYIFISLYIYILYCQSTIWAWYIVRFHLLLQHIAGTCDPIFFNIYKFDLIFYCFFNYDMFINCNWVSTRWQWSVKMYINRK